MKKSIVLFCVLVSTIAVHAQFMGKGRKDVPPMKGTLTLHPDSVTLKGKDKELYFYFFDATNKCLFVTSNKKIYDSISTFLPVRMIEERSVILEGTIIDPFTIFSKEDLSEVSKSLGIKLNKFKVVKIFNYGLKEDVVVKYTGPK
jgi:hypothetical protein